MNETGGFASLPHGRFAFVISSRRVSQAKTNCQLILLLFEKDFDHKYKVMKSNDLQFDIIGGLKKSGEKQSSIA
jgi:hypothetical protein